MPHEAVSLPEPMRATTQYSTPGYYVVDQTGGAVSGPYPTPSLGFANLHDGVGVQYLDAPRTGELLQGWPPELHTVVGHNQGDVMSYSEADLLRAMSASTDINEQRRLMGALEDVRSQQRQALGGRSQMGTPSGLGSVAAERVPFAVHNGAFGSSSMTDWLGDLGNSDEGMQEHMLTMGSRFFIGCHPEVKADPIEYMTQALGVARVAAGQFNDINRAVNIFMEHAAALNRVDMNKVAVDELLPWAASPEVLPPTVSDYPGEESVNKNTGVNLSPPGDYPSGLGNDAERPLEVTSAFSYLSNHDGMDEFLFAGPTPEELAQASGPGDLNQQFGAPAVSQDATPEPNDDGALSGALRGEMPILATRTRRLAADDDSGGDGDEGYKYIKHRPDAKDAEGQSAPWVIVQKGTGKELSAHTTKEKAIEAFKAMEWHKHSSRLYLANQYIQERDGEWVILQKGTGKVLSHHDSKEEAEKSFAAMEWHKHGGSLKIAAFIEEGKVSRVILGSRAFSPQPTTYDEYLSRLAPGSAAVSREFYSGAMAAVSPSAHDPSVPSWSKRQAATSPGLWSATHIYEPIGWDAFDPRPHPGSRQIRSGSPVMFHEVMSPVGPGGMRLVHVEDESGNHQTVDTRSLKNLGRSRQAANEEFLNPQAFTNATMDGSTPIRPQSDGTYNPEDTWLQSGEAAHDVDHLIPQTDLSATFDNITDFPLTGPDGWPSNRGAHEGASSYSRDPYWMVAKYPGVCGAKGCDDEISRGDRIFYYPSSRTAYVGQHADAASRDFNAARQDEDAYNRFGSLRTAATPVTDRLVNEYLDINSDRHNTDRQVHIAPSTFVSYNLHGKAKQYGGDYLRRMQTKLQQMAQDGEINEVQTANGSRAFCKHPDHFNAEGPTEEISRAGAAKQVKSPTQMSVDEFLGHMEKYHGHKINWEAVPGLSPDDGAVMALEKAHNIDHDMNIPMGRLYGPDHRHERLGGASVGVVATDIPAGLISEGAVDVKRRADGDYAIDDDGHPIAYRKGEGEAEEMKDWVEDHPLRSEGYRRTAVAPKEYGEETGFETGGNGYGVPGAYEPDRSLYAESPQGQADDTQGYEQAYSSGRPIDYSGTGEDVLGTVPVQGYLYDADHPNGEMWPWQQQPIGSPPQGAANVAGLPTPGMVSAQETGSSWPQPQITANTKLNAFRAAVAQSRS